MRQCQQSPNHVSNQIYPKISRRFYPENLAGISLYISASNGSDSNDGSFSRPFKTLQKAQKVVREIPKVQPITIYLRKGTYYLGQTFSLTPEDSKYYSFFSFLLMRIFIFSK
jgi:hypothetical protein